MSDTTDVTSGVSDVADESAGTSSAPKRRRGGTGLAAMLLPELQSLAASLGISGTARMRKGELITAISERQGGGGAPAAATGSTRSGRSRANGSAKEPGGGTDTAVAEPASSRPTAVATAPVVQTTLPVGGGAPADAPTAPVQAAPAQDAPAQSASAQSASAQSTSGQNAPSQNAPSQGAAAETETRERTDGDRDQQRGERDRGGRDRQRNRNDRGDRPVQRRTARLKAESSE